MSSKDTTREKLMGSMRKTKADAGIGSHDTPQAETTKNAAPAKKPAANKLARKPEEKPPVVSVDHYQSGRRVWPD